MSSCSSPYVPSAKLRAKYTTHFHLTHAFSAHPPRPIDFTAAGKICFELYRLDQPAPHNLARLVPQNDSNRCRNLRYTSQQCHQATQTRGCSSPGVPVSHASHSHRRVPPSALFGAHIHAFSRVPGRVQGEGVDTYGAFGEEQEVNAQGHHAHRADPFIFARIRLAIRGLISNIEGSPKGFSA